MRTYKDKDELKNEIKNGNLKFKLATYLDIRTSEFKWHFWVVAEFFIKHNSQ